MKKLFLGLTLFTSMSVIALENECNQAELNLRNAENEHIMLKQEGDDVTAQIKSEITDLEITLSKVDESEILKTQVIKTKIEIKIFKLCQIKFHVRDAKSSIDLSILENNLSCLDLKSLDQ
jgi:hypothetical protein